MKAVDIKQLKKYGWAKLLKGALSDDFCDKLVLKMNEQKWEDARINGGGTQIIDKSVRDCKRIMQIDHELSDHITNIIDEFLPENFNDCKKVGLNPMFRFLKYGIGNYFKRHYDLRYTDKDNNISLITVQIYLNDDFEGGETVFYDGDYYGDRIYTYVPKKGDIILFDQIFEHEGSKIKEGIKYCVRTEAMYKE